jgi:preprotein translocase subunit SecD
MKRLVFVLVLLAAFGMVYAGEEGIPTFNVEWKDLRSVTLTHASRGAVSVEFKMTVEKANAYVKFVEANLGKQVRFTLNGQPQKDNPPVLIRERITGDSLGFAVPNLAEANRLIRLLTYLPTCGLRTSAS